MYAPRVAKGVKKTRKTYRIQIYGVEVRPWSFKSTRSPKPLKNSQISSKTPVFERFLASSALKTSWSHLNPRNSNSVGLSRFFDTLGHPGGEQLVEISSILSVFLPYLTENALWWNLSLGKYQSYACLYVLWVLNMVIHTILTIIFDFSKPL